MFYTVYCYIFYGHQRHALVNHLQRASAALKCSVFYGFYFIYLFICQTVLDALNCVKITSEDGVESEEEYLTSAPEEICWTPGEMQQRLVPYAAVFVCLYVAGYPVLLYVLTTRPATMQKIIDDQLLRVQGRGGYEEGLTSYLEEVSFTRSALGLLYYRFKPEMPFWILVVVLRKCAMACITVLFHQSSIFQLAMLTLVLFISLVLQMRNLPYISPRDSQSILLPYEQRLKDLTKEESRCQKKRDAELAKGREKTVSLNAFAAAHRRQQEGMNAGELAFEYNTVEMMLLAASIFVCGARVAGNPKLTDHSCRRRTAGAGLGRPGVSSDVSQVHFRAHARVGVRRGRPAPQHGIHLDAVHAGGTRGLDALLHRGALARARRAGYFAAARNTSLEEEDTPAVSRRGCSRAEDAPAAASSRRRRPAETRAPGSSLFGDGPGRGVVAPGPSRPLKRMLSGRRRPGRGVVAPPRRGPPAFLFRRRPGRRRPAETGIPSAPPLRSRGVVWSRSDPRAGNSRGGPAVPGHHRRGHDRRQEARG